MQKKLWLRIGYLYVSTLTVFFVVFLLFRNQEVIQISPYQYLISTAIANAFVLTSIYALYAAFHVIRQIRQRTGSFGRIFRFVFFSGALAGTLSLISIYVFLYSFAPEAVEEIKNQYFAYSLVEAKQNGTYEEVAKMVNNPQVQKTSLLTWRTFTLTLASILFYNFSLALTLSFLWRVKKVN